MRKFIYETWPQFVEPAQMKERVEQAQEALKVCRKVNDPFGPRKLLAVAISHGNKLAELGEGHENDTKLQEEIQKVPIVDLINDARNAVKETPAP